MAEEGEEIDLVADTHATPFLRRTCHKFFFRIGRPGRKPMRQKHDWADLIISTSLYKINLLRALMLLDINIDVT